MVFFMNKKPNVQTNRKSNSYFFSSCSLPLSLCHFHAVYYLVLHEYSYNFRDLPAREIIFMLPQMDVTQFAEFESYYEQYKENNDCKWCRRYGEVTEKYGTKSEWDREIRRISRSIVQDIAHIDWAWVRAVFRKLYRFVSLLVLLWKLRMKLNVVAQHKQ